MRWTTFIAFAFRDLSVLDTASPLSHEHHQPQPLLSPSPSPCSPTSFPTYPPLFYFFTPLLYSSSRPRSERICNVVIILDLVNGKVRIQYTVLFSKPAGTARSGIVGAVVDDDVHDRPQIHAVPRFDVRERERVDGVYSRRHRHELHAH
jgi:hypothetical protein